MIRTQISLTDAQMARLRAESMRRGVSIAALVREGVDRLLRGPEWETRRSAALGAIGAVASTDVSDVAERHDAYLTETHAE